MQCAIIRYQLFVVNSKIYDKSRYVDMLFVSWVITNVSNCTRCDELRCIQQSLKCDGIINYIVLWLTAQ